MRPQSGGHPLLTLATQRNYSRVIYAAIFLPCVVVWCHIHMATRPGDAGGLVAAWKVPFGPFGDLAIVVEFRIVRCAEPQPPTDHAR